MRQLHQLVACVCQDGLLTVKLDGARLCAERDDRVVEADVNGPDGARLLAPDDVDRGALVQVENYQLAVVVASVQVSARAAELEAADGARQCPHVPRLVAGLHIPQDDLLVTAAGGDIVHVRMELNRLHVGQVAALRHEDAQRFGVL